MKKIYYLMLVLLLLTGLQQGLAQSSPNCATSSDDDYFTGKAFFNYGSLTGAFNTKNRLNATIGQPVLGSYFGKQNQGAFGFWARYLLPPAPPMVRASEGDLEDRVQVDWSPDPLSPVSKSFKIYRNGSLLATVDGETFSFLDFNVLAGKFYTYEVAGVNQFGEGSRGKALGFLNPNGVITGQVKTLGGNPVPGAVVSLSPTLGAALSFDGNGSVFAEYNPVFPRSTFTITTWVKLNTGNDGAGILDLGSSISKNWWLHTLPASSGLGVKFGMGQTGGSPAEMSYVFPAATATDWHYIAASYNGSALLLYVDGELVATAIGSVAAGNSVLYLGKRSDAGGFLKGKIDEVRFFDRQLPQTEIQMLMNKTASANTPGLVTYWKFDEGVGTKGFDISSNKLKAYLCSARWTSDKPNVINAGIADATGFYKIDAVNYGAGTTFTARPSKSFYSSQSLEFNGVNRSYADLTSFALKDSATITVVVKAFDFSNNQAILSKANAGGTNQFLLCLNRGKLDLGIGSEVYTFGDLGMGFHHLALVMRKAGATLNVTLYKDGNLLGTHSFSATDWTGLPWKLGAQADGASAHKSYFTGLIDEVAFFSELLSLPNIQTYANIGTNVTNSNLSSYFNLNEGTDISLHDMGTSLTGSGTSHGAGWSTLAAIVNEVPHKFSPSTRLVTLTPSNTSTDQVDFTDQSTVPVSGYVRYEGTDCFVKGAEILVNGQRNFPAVFTDSTGYFSIDLEPGATVRLTPTYQGHSFYPAFWDIDKIASPVAGILFRNQTKRTVSGQLAGNSRCRKSIIPANAIVKVKVETLDGCFKKIIQVVEENGKFLFKNLPPLKMTIAVTEHSNNVIYNYFQLKGGVTIDLTNNNDTTDFIYYSPPVIEIAQLDTNRCGDPMLEQSSSYSTTIKVYQPYDGGRCYLDSAMLHIDNEIANKPAFDTLMTGGKFKYRFPAGLPNIIPPYLKTMTVQATANTLTNTATTTAVVLGKRPRAVNFTSTSPEIPIMILRDPPGDGSSVTMEKGKTICNGWSIGGSVKDKFSAGLELKLGLEQSINTGIGVEKTTKIKIENTNELSMSMTMGSNISKETEVCVTANESISTSDGDVIIGEDADVYMGGALNLLFGITDDLRYDTLHCSFYIHPGVVVFPDKFKTTFLYSNYQIRRKVIPNLELVGDTTSANAWRRILQYNKDLKAKAVFEKNISIDAGVTYESSTTTENTQSLSYGFDIELTTALTRSLGGEVDGIGVKGKIGMELTMGTNTSFSSKETNSQTIAYTLADNDIGDVFTIDIMKDKVYATPVFKTVSGNTSCPHEPNTVPRDGVELTVDRTIITNVSENAAAVYKFKLGNSSQTDEYRYYQFDLLDVSNPKGAVVTIQGAGPGQGRNFGIPAGQSQDVIVTVERGPEAYDYENLVFQIYAPCENGRYTDLGDGDFPPYPLYKSVSVSTHFLEPCSPIDVGFPLQNWVLTPADGSTLFITLNDFNRNDTDLELIRVQYRRAQGDGAWINITEVPKNQLDNDVFKIVEWNTAGLKDGIYEIRAVTQCTGGQNAGISHVISGRIERVPPALFGTPQPSDGVLSLGDEISIQFTEPIQCDRLIQADFFNNNNIGLYDTETGNLVDATVTCNGDKITIVPKVPNRFIENKVLRVQVNNIKDLVGNNFVEKKWEFFVDRNPVRWLDGAVEVVKYEEDFVSVTRKIQNTGGQATDYEILDIPSWVRVFPKKGTLAPGVAQPITFEFDSTMAFGAYLDTLFLDVVEGKEPVIVDARVVCHEPAWAVNPKAYSYSMNMTLQLDIEGVFSADRQDIVAAFIKGECRGLTKVKYEPTLKKWLAFLTVYSNNFTGDSIKLQIWDASACLLYGSVLEKFAFESEELVGSPLTPMTVRTNNLLLRKISLGEGWNWVSFNLEFPNPSINSALSSLRRPQNDFIKGQTLFSQYFNAGNQWVGSLSTLGNKGMYQYRADARDTIDMLGRPINLTTTTIPVNVGWNWIGYLPQSPMPLNTALSSLRPLNGDVIKSQTGFAQYVAGYGWLGNLQYMEAPEGYLLKISNAGTLSYPLVSTLTETPKEKSKVNPLAANYWTLEPSKFEHTMTLIGMVTSDKLNVTTENFELGAFSGGAVRGSAPAIFVKSLNAYLFFITIYSNKPGELITFKLYDGNNIKNLKETLYFSIDAQIGMVQDPQPFSLLTTTGTQDLSLIDYFEVAPNPFHDQTTLRFSSDQAGEAQFTVLDVMGRVQDQWRVNTQAGMNEYRWNTLSKSNGAFASGVYLLKLEINGKVTVKKVVLQR